MAGTAMVIRPRTGMATATARPTGTPTTAGTAIMATAPSPATATTARTAIMATNAGTVMATVTGTHTATAMATGIGATEAPSLTGPASPAPLTGPPPHAVAAAGAATALRVPWSLLPLSLAVALPVLVQGGFTAGSRSLLMALAAISLSLALLRDERRVIALLRAPAVLCLLGLAALAILSSAWTIGSPTEAIRWGLVIASLAAIAIVAGQAGGRDRVASLAVLIVALAALEAVLGLVSAGLRVGPYAERIGGSWRPGGTFEYPPALALLQVSAMPALLRWMAGSRPRVAVPAAAGAALAGAVIALAASRAGAALCLAVLAVAVAAPRPTIGVSRRAVLVAVAVPVGAGVAAHLTAGGYSFPGATGGDPPRLVGLAVIVAACAGAWALVCRSRGWRRLSVPDARNAGGRAGRVAGLVALVVIGLVALTGFAGGADRSGVEPVSGFTHGRFDQWRVAAATALDRPLTGTGAEAYLHASRQAQGDQAVMYAHDLPLEAWAELGPLGLGVVLALYGSVAVLLWRIRSQPQAWLVAPAAGAFLVANLVDWPWHLAGSAAVWAVAVGACLALLESPSPGAVGGRIAVGRRTDYLT